MGEVGIDSASPGLSRRAARRVIQRAFVLTARDRNVRQHIRETELTTLWTLADWEFTWTVVLDRGRMRFERRPTKRASLTLTWPVAADFFRQVEAGRLTPDLSTDTPPPRRTIEIVCHAFCRSLREVLENPVDENGDPLV